MVKGFRQIASLTALSRVLGMLRDIAFAYFLGAGGLMDSWVIAFKIPNLTRRLFGEGAASASFIPIYSEELHRDPKNAEKLACTVVTVVFVILAVVVLIAEAGLFIYYKYASTLESNKLMLRLTAVMLPYMIMICVVAILGGILNSHRHFAAPAAAPIVLNIFIIGSLCFTGWVVVMQQSRQVFVVAIAVLIVGFIQIAMQIIPLIKKGIYIKPAWHIQTQPFKKIIFLMGPMILGLTATQLNTLADDIIARCLSGSVEKGDFFSWFGSQIKYPVWDGAVSMLYYSQRLYQFPLGVLGISLATAIFPVMSADAARNDFDSLKKTISRGLRGAVFISIPATAGLIIVAKPLVSVLFERGEFSSEDTNLAAWTLLFYSLGLCGYFSQQIATRAFYSVKDSKMPAKSAAIAVIVNIILNLTLIWFLGTGGLALSTALCSYLQVIILVIVLKKRFGKSILNGLADTFVKTVIGTCVMSLICVIVILLMKNLPFNFYFNIIRLLVVVPLSAIIYVLIAKKLRNEMLSLVTGKIHPE